MIWANRHSCAFPYPELALIDCYYVESSTGRVLLFKITETSAEMSMSSYWSVAA